MYVKEKLCLIEVMLIDFMFNRSYAKEKGYYKNKLCYYAKVMLIEFMLRRSYVNRIYV